MSLQEIFQTVQGLALELWNGQLRLAPLWHRRPHRQLTKVLLVMVRWSLI